MKKVFRIIVLLILVLPMLFSCAEKEEDIILPSSRTLNRGEINVSYSDEPYTIDDYLSDSEMVARINIGNWIEWTYDENGSVDGAKYEAEVIEIYKGGLSDKIIYRQSSFSQIGEYPWHAHGDELLLFTRCDKENDYYSGIAYDIVYNEDGTPYVLAPIEDKMAIEIDVAVSGRGIYPTYQLIKCKAEDDPYWDEISAETMMAFRLDDFAKYVRNKCE